MTPVRRCSHTPAGQRGLTLVELMVVVAIIATLSAAIGFGVTRTSNHGEVKSFAQRLLIAMRQARATASASGAVVRVVVAARSVVVERASKLGSGPPSGSSWLRLHTAESGNLANVFAVTQVATVASATPSAGGVPATITFEPDGSATSATVYVRDESDKYHYKVVVFGLTGFSKVLSRW